MADPGSCSTGRGRPGLLEVGCGPATECSWRPKALAAIGTAVLFAASHLAAQVATRGPARGTPQAGETR